MAKYTRLTQEQKTKIICFSEENIGNRDIARRLGVNESSVRRFLKTYRTTGTKCQRKYAGRSRVLNRRDENHLKRLCLQQRFQSASKLREELQNITKKSCSTSTVERRLREMGLNSCRPAKKPLLTWKMRVKRKEWCKNHQSWTSSEWGQVIFSDETKINLMGADGGARVRRRSGERFSENCILPVVRHSPSVMVWGAITSKGVGEILIIDGSINAVAYKKIIDDGVLPTIEYLSEYTENVIFQDDSAPCHRAASVKNYKDVLGITSLNWPGNSPDLNPIENLWAIMKRRVRQKEPKTIPELKKIIIEVWFNEIDKNYLENLYNSMPGRLNDVIKAKGGHINK